MIKQISKALVRTALLGSVAWLPTMVLAQDPDGVFEAPDRPTLNFYGVPGLIDTPSAEALPDGQIAVNVSNFAGITRTTFTFQATPRIQASFRYSGIQDAGIAGFDTFRDRSFDVRFLLNRESSLLPAVTLGFQDLAGTGIYAAEYLVATKTFEGGRIPGTIKASAGLGWGRLGTAGGLGAPFGDTRPVFEGGDTGGEPSTDQWFRGEVAPFAGIEWEVTDRIGLKAEYSSDAYELENRNGVLESRSRFNFGAEYQLNDSIRIGGYYLFGSEFGVNASLQFNPSRPVAPVRIAAPAPYALRPSRRDNPEAFEQSWAAAGTEASSAVRDALTPELAKEGLTLIEARTTATTTEVRYSNQRYRPTSVSVGRVARVMARFLPSSVETFRIVPVVDNLAQAAVVLRRSDLEALEVAPDSTAALLAVTGIESAPATLPGSARNPDLFPSFQWSVLPFASQQLFDPDQGVQIEAGLEFNASFRPAPGWQIAGQLRQRLTGPIDSGDGENTSVLPRVRTDGALFSENNSTNIENLYVNRQWKMSPDVYARVTAGYLERAFGGVSSEVLWKPVASRLALGVEANYVQQRAFDSITGFQDFNVATGHASAYYQFNNGFTGQIDMGRFLAGDYGATFALEREFANGWRVGGFFTLTNVSAEDFGEGSFDKGIKFTVPLDWLLGNSNTRTQDTTLRSLTRDGGARLEVPNRLFDQVRDSHRKGIVESFSGVWE